MAAAAAAAANTRAAPSVLRLWPWLWLWLWASLSPSPPSAHAQYIQSYHVVKVTGQPDKVQWRPTMAHPHQDVYDFAPNVIVVEYNCAYMTAICQNVKKFKDSATNQARLFQNIFGFDPSTKRSKKRGTAMCPNDDSWKRKHPCPEVANVPAGNLAQPDIQRNNKKALPQHATWPTKGIKPWSGKMRKGIPKLEMFIEDYVDAAGNTVPSWMEYTCDEFPMRSLIEGGDGLSKKPPNPPPVEGIGAPGETRCAAARVCSGAGAAGIASEQNWQARANILLHKQMKAMGTAIDPNYVANHKDRPTLFRLDLANHGFNGEPAIIYWGPTNSPTVLPHVAVPMASKRDAGAFDGDKMAFLKWMDKVPLEELLSGEGGHRIMRKSVMVNDTDDDIDASEMAMSMRDMGLDLDLGGSMHESQGDEEDEEDEEGAEEQAEEHVVAANGARKLLPRAHLLARLNASGPTDNSTAPLLRNATQADLEAALALVDAAIDESSRLNEARYASPARNMYKLRPGTSPGGDGARIANLEPEEAPPPPLIEMTPELAAAAALVAEAEALQVELGPGNGTATRKRQQQPQKKQKRAGTFWMEHIARRGTVPLGNDASYKVFRNVMDYGAKGDGVTDDTAAIQRAMDDGRRCGKGCNGSTTKNAIVYLPPGRYLVSRSIQVVFGTQLIGDAVDWPTIVASARFIGLGALETDVVSLVLSCFSLLFLSLVSSRDNSKHSTTC